MVKLKMVGIIDTCIKCGERFCRGIYPQKTCDICSPKKVYNYIDTISYTYKNKKR